MTRRFSSPPRRGGRPALAATIALALSCLVPVSALARTGGDCQPDPETLCLLGDRFKVMVEWHDFSPNPLAVPGTPENGVGDAVPVTGGNPSVSEGYFWFFASQNVDLIVKVFDGRQINGHFWVFAGSLTNVEYHLTVVDTQTDTTKQYVNPPEGLTVTFDTNAFSDPPGQAAELPASTSSLVSWTGTSRAVPTDRVPRRVLLPKGERPSCADPHVACVQGGRIAIEADSPTMMGGPADIPGEPVVTTATSALFRYFDNSGFDLGVKTVDGRSVNGEKLEVWIEQTGTGQVNYYTLDAPGPASSDLTGFFDRRGFAPE